MISSSKIVKLWSVPLFIAACVLLYFGSTMLLLVPSYRGESYFAGRIEYGVLPTLGSIVLLITVGWLWARATSMSLGKSIGWAFAGAIAAIALFWIGLIIVAGVEQA